VALLLPDGEVQAAAPASGADPAPPSEPFSAPIRVRGQPAGALHLVTPQARALDRRDAQLATALVERAGQALENALLYQEAQEAIQVREEFISVASHELRTPLTALKVHAQNAARAGSDTEREASLRLMLEGLERSIRLAEQMLAYSRAAAAQAPPEAQTVPLREVAEEALEDVLPLVRQRGQRVALTSDPPVADLPVRGERDKLTTLARNLLDNASRYAPEGSTLRVELKGEDRYARFSVVDEGAGIPAALRERVFESYYRIPGSRGEGSGLGLAIVREIAAQHGGSVEIGEGDGGRGTRVSVRLPALAENGAR
jgi:two-component system sensor histidine kinase QseC